MATLHARMQMIPMKRGQVETKKNLLVSLVCSVSLFGFFLSDTASIFSVHAAAASAAEANPPGRRISPAGRMSIFLRGHALCMANASRVPNLL